MPGGTYSLAAGNPLPLSCGVDLAIARCFTCVATHPGAFSTVTGYSYRDPADPRIGYEARDRFGTVNVPP
ncbi:hypothetical protein WT08_05335 [Burkholderia sp. MSMB1552]|nr:MULTISPECIES: hypothetical protein [unclassified Burkholderia]KVN16859.1 hypothetical protein WT08_05335 [Burkholderia sp. MSMB1552]KWZ51259.1 hypothetical protein WS92_28645 [Burkholderia sp. MSMB1588]